MAARRMPGEPIDSRNSYDAFIPPPRPSTDSAHSTESLLDQIVSHSPSHDDGLADDIEMEDWHSLLVWGRNPGWQVGSRDTSYLPRVWHNCHYVLNKGLNRAKSTVSNLAARVRTSVSSTPQDLSSSRNIYLNPKRQGHLVDERTRRPYVSNSIRSSRYTIWNFLPRQLVAQFSKTANFYFMIVAILQAIPNLSTTGNFTTFIPLSIFVSISMAKEGFDDFRRYRLDREENNRKIPAIRPAENLDTTASWKLVKWSTIKVGDVVSLGRDQIVPADIMLLHIQGPVGVAHIDTMALDGETNLKSKQPCAPVAETCNSLEAILASTMHIVVQNPNPELHKFDGHVTIGQERAFLTNDNIVYRGSVLRNVSQALGLVIYTGEECKVRMNANKRPRIKAPALQGRVNRVILLVVGLVFTLVMVCTLAYILWFSGVENGFWYLHKAKVALGPEFISFFIMFNTMIPLSLYTSMEIIKVAQVFLLHDPDMYDESTNTPLQAHTSTINEDLGQVSFIFSDKTGTLTENQMQLRKISVAGVAYIHDTPSKSAVTDSARSSLSPKPRPQFPRTTDLVDYIRNNPEERGARQAKLLLLNIALCHTCIPDPDSSQGGAAFQGVSPDELALLIAAKELGYVLVDRQPLSITLRVSHDGQRDETYRILDVIEFSTTRKRMSVIVKMPDGQICLFCKGADSVVRMRLQAPLADVMADFKSKPDSPPPPFPEVKDQASLQAENASERCFHHLDEFASEGLRTLLHGHRFIDEKAYTRWKQLYTQALFAANDKPDAIEEIIQQIEDSLELSGATAIEDKLQRGVPDAIDMLRQANIKLWMLTGDKRETAVSIGHSCHLLHPHSTVIHLDQTNFLTAINQAKEALQKQRVLSELALIIDGPALTAVQSHKQALDDFFSLCLQATTLICCRASPKQKAFVVKHIRKYSHNATTLAIGDGANDIAMIQEADIGIGIAGKEGLEAARISDYSIGQFRFLVKLLLVHGHWNYVRICKYTLGTFWKEVIFYTTQALYQHSNGYTGTSLYEPWGLSMFNTLFTSISVMLLGIFTQDLSASTLLAFPEIYQTGQRNQYFNIPIYLGWTVMAFAEALMIYFLMLTLYAPTGANPTTPNDIFSFGTLTFSACVIIVNIKLQFLEVYNKTLISIFALVSSVGGLFLWNTVLSSVYKFESGQGIYHVHRNFLHEAGRDLWYWVALLLIVSCVVLFEVAVTAIRTWLLPTDVDLFQMFERKTAITSRGGNERDMWKWPGRAG
ncbi:hypothetical protein BJX63DRAFT_300236 [Aspergillus granulosus]|uniref:Phospholipid-transporting ATPase n=1 Tax=Aspergillus granulosus TaxID=176169 RepID=A0ABR4H5Z7_9EURO